MELNFDNNAAAAAAKSLQSCLTLCDPIDGSPPGSSVPGILQAGILEWVAISFSNAYMHAKSLQSFLTLCDPIVSRPPGSFRPWDFPGKSTGFGVPLPSSLYSAAFCIPLMAQTLPCSKILSLT